MKIFWILSLALLVSSCHKKPISEQSGSYLRLNLAEDPVSLDPRLVRSIKDLTVVKQLYEGLMRLDASGCPQLAIAQSYTITNGGKTYTFKLKETFWNNQEPVTAYDFRDSWLSVIDPSFPCGYANALYPIKNVRAFREGKCALQEVGITAEDGKTLVVELEAVTPYFLELTAFPTFFPVNGQDITVSNGPFQLKKWEVAQKLTFEKNPHYWDRQNVFLQGLQFSVIPDNLTEAYLFQKDELDWIGQPLSRNISSDLLKELKKEGELLSYSVAGTYWLKFNTQATPLEDKNLRKALGIALSRQNLIEHILQGSQSVATRLIPPNMHAEMIHLFPDGEKGLAKQLLTQSLAEKGWQKLPPLVLSFPAHERSLKIALFIADEWKKTFDVDVELCALEPHVFREQVKQGHYQIGVGDWIADFSDPVAFLEIFTTPDNGTGWQNLEFCKLIDASLDKEPQVRKELLLQAEKLLLDEMPISPLYHYSFDYLKKETVCDVILSQMGIADFKTAKIRP